MSDDSSSTWAYEPEPYSQLHLDTDFRAGLVSLGAIGLMSLICILPIIFFVIYRLFLVRNIHLNQPVVLCFNLLLADLFQAISFLASFHWSVVDGIYAHSLWCDAQGCLLNIGDLVSGFFVLFIAIHTAYTLKTGKKICHMAFGILVSGCWAFGLFLSLIGPVLRGPTFFARSGGWCWISPRYDTERLVCHYLWTFINEFGTIVIYLCIFIFLKRKMRSVRTDDENIAVSSSVTRASKLMILYPIAYVVTTLPLAIGRMASAAGVEFSLDYFWVAGALLASGGWVDAILYTLTRRILLSTDSSNHTLRFKQPRLMSWYNSRFSGLTSVLHPDAMGMQSRQAYRSSTVLPLASGAMELLPTKYTTTPSGLPSSDASPYNERTTACKRRDSGFAPLGTPGTVSPMDGLLSCARNSGFSISHHTLITVETRPVPDLEEGLSPSSSSSPSSSNAPSGRATRVTSPVFTRRTSNGNSNRAAPRTARRTAQPSSAMVPQLLSLEPHYARVTEDVDERRRPPFAPGSRKSSC